MAAGGLSVPATSYDAAFARLAERLPPDERAARAAALGRFAERGFPTPRLEAWRYTDLGALAQQSFELAEPPAQLPDLAPHLLDDAEHLVFVNGVLRPELCRLAEPELFGGATSADATPADDAILALNRAFAGAGCRLHLPRGRALARPLQVLLVTLPGATPAMAHLSHRISLEPGASARVLLQHLGLGAGPHFATHALAVELGEGAQLELCRVQEDGAATQQLFRGDVRVARDARLQLTNVDLGGGLVRNDWNVSLDGPGAGVALNGLYALSGTSHVDNHTRIDHRCPHGSSRELFRGIVGDAARAVFNGKIVVHPSAQKTDSEQRVANLLLSPRAEVNAKPELEIYADDVKCAHGATFGQLDETAVFYLRSRGLSTETARAMLTWTFAWEVLGRIADPALRRLAEQRFLARLPAGLALDLEGLL